MSKRRSYRDDLVGKVFDVPCSSLAELGLLVRFFNSRGFCYVEHTSMFVRFKIPPR